MSAANLAPSWSTGAKQRRDIIVEILIVFGLIACAVVTIGGAIAKQHVIEACQSGDRSACAVLGAPVLQEGAK